MHTRIAARYTPHPQLATAFEVHVHLRTKPPDSLPCMRTSLHQSLRQLCLRNERAIYFSKDRQKLQCLQLLREVRLSDL